MLLNLGFNLWHRNWQHFTQPHYIEIRCFSKCFILSKAAVVFYPKVLLPIILRLITKPSSLATHLTYVLWMRREAKCRVCCVHNQTSALNVKGSGHIIFGMKSFLVTSNGERLVVHNVVRISSLWSGVVFEKEVIFHEFDFETLDIWGIEIKHLKAHNFVWQWVFILSLLSRNFDDQLSSNFHRFVIKFLCIMLRYTNYQYCLVKCRR